MFTCEGRELWQAKRELDKSHHDSLSGLSKTVMMPKESGEPAEVADVDTKIRH